MQVIQNMGTLLLLSLMLFTPLIAMGQESEIHHWTAAKGKSAIDAAMVLSTADKLTADVTLIKSDKSRVTVSFEKLSRQSQNLAKKLRRDFRKQQAPAATPNAPQRQAAVMDATKLATSETNSPDDTQPTVWNWRGPNRDGQSTESGLLTAWPEGGPELKWTANGLGNAMSSVAISGDRIFTLGNRGGQENLIAIGVADGKELWSTQVGQGGDSNSTPTVDGDQVYAIGLAGDLICANAGDGREVWRKSFANDFGGKMMSQWGYSESPLVDGDQLICTPGGPQAMIVALDKRSGKLIWKTPMKPGGSRGVDGAGYSSVVISNGGGVKQYITLVGRGLISVAAKDGRPLWQYERIANGTANVPTPIVEGDFVFCSSGYDDGGTALLKLTGRRGKVGVQEVYYQSANQLQNHHGGMVKIGNYVYLGEGHNQGFPMCVEFKTGKKMWPKQRGAGNRSAAIVAADGHLYFRYENGIMALIEATPKKYNLKSSFKIASVQRESWPHPVIFDGHLYLRDQDSLHCYDIRAKQ